MADGSSTLRGMSRDIFVQDIPEGVSSVEEIPDDWVPQPLAFGSAEVVAAVLELVPSADVSDPEWLRVLLRGADIEISLSGGSSLESFALHVRASDDAPADEFVRRLLARLGARALDPEAQTGIFQ